MICADTGQWGQAAERFAVEVSAGYDRGASVSQASLLWALAHARDWNEAETVLLRDRGLGPGRHPANVPGSPSLPALPPEKTTAPTTGFWDHPVEIAR